jgi:glycosyltransferase involved in cell wall biosynthesis
MPQVSVLLAAWNERRHIDAHIGSFLSLDYPNIELVICAGGADGTFEQARKYACDRIIVLEQRAGEGKQAALARCLTRASGEVLYFTDADCRYSDEALVRLLAPLATEGEHAATGGSRPLAEQAQRLLPLYLWTSDVVASSRQGKYTQGLLGRNAAVTRYALDQSGGLSFPAPTGTDYQLARRLIEHGFAIRHVPTSVVASEYPESLQVYRHKQSRWLRNLLIYGLRYGATRDLRATLITVVSGAVMLVAPLTALLAGRRVLAPWSVLVLYAIGAKVRYLLFTSLLYQQPVPAKVYIGLAPLRLIDFAIWLSPAIDLLSARRRHQW